MKKLIPALCFIMAFANLNAQEKEPPAMKSLKDSASYAIGMSMANFYKQQGIKNINTELLTQAINDVLSGSGTRINDQQANSVLMNYMNQLQAEKSRPNIEEGERFLARNKKEPGVVTTPSGLQYEVLVSGSGHAPQPTDSVVCHYVGKLLNGTEFDNSYKRGEPITFAVNGVIRGWTEGLQLMNPGSKFRFWVPYKLGYGAHDYGQIPGGSLLVFEVELLEVK